jgi:hypothetical protein
MTFCVEFVEFLFLLPYCSYARIEEINSQSVANQFLLGRSLPPCLQVGIEGGYPCYGACKPIRPNRRAVVEMEVQVFKTRFSACFNSNVGPNMVPT